MLKGNFTEESNFYATMKISALQCPKAEFGSLLLNISKSIIFCKIIFNFRKIWDLFSISVHKSRQLLKSTIQEEYRKRLAQLKDEDPGTKHERKEKLLDISLDHVYNLSSFLVIIFKCNRNDIANELITHTLATQNQSADLEIFDVCLEYDEDISM